MTRIEQIRQREQQATKGPWFAEPSPRKPGRCDGIRTAVHSHEPAMQCWDAETECPAASEIVTTDGGYYGPKWADAEFIAHAREDIPHLLSAWDTRDAALRTLVEQWRADVAYLRQRADARYAEQTAAGLVASDALIAAVRAVEQRADALDAILKETTTL